MKLHSTKRHRPFQVLLSLIGVAAFVVSSSAQQSPTPRPASASKAAATAPLSKKEFAERKKQLLKTKQVNKWPVKIKGQPGSIVVDLTVSECTWLGGKVEYWASCGGTSMKCVGANGREICITEIK